MTLTCTSSNKQTEGQEFPPSEKLLHSFTHILVQVRRERKREEILFIHIIIIYI